MNNDRRKQIQAARDKINELRSTFEQPVNDLGDIRSDEQDAFDNLPEGLQQADRGQQMEEAINKLDDAVNSLEYFDFDEIDSALEEAAQWSADELATASETRLGASGKRTSAQHTSRRNTTKTPQDPNVGGNIEMPAGMLTANLLSNRKASSSKRWVLTWLDADGKQVGDVAYFGTKTEGLNAIAVEISRSAPSKNFLHNALDAAKAVGTKMAAAFAAPVEKELPVTSIVVEAPAVVKTVKVDEPAVLLPFDPKRLRKEIFNGLTSTAATALTVSQLVIVNPELKTFNIGKVSDMLSYLYINGSKTGVNRVENHIPGDKAKFAYFFDDTRVS